VITYLQQSLDRMCIGLATASVRSGWRRPDQTDRAAKLLAAPDLFAPEVPAAKLEFKGSRRFVFNSVVETPWDVTPAHGVFWRAGRDWQKKPAVILIHGWNGEMGYYFSFPGIQMALARRGVNALKFELPFHGLRRPMKRGQINNLISDDLVTMIEGVRQCLADILSLRLWLLEQGCASVSLWGYSLGGWLAGLLCAHPRPFQAAVLMNAVARMDIAMATLPFAKPVRESMAAAPVNLDIFSLRSLKPTTDRILIMEGMRDLFVPAGTLDDLAKHWPNAELWRMRHSHISICFGPLTLLRAVRWLASRVNENSNGH
jgi:pimeloyl-ACP methyl ester carboxylesterase